MSNIAKVIGWKFNHQEGMETKDGVITKFPGGIPSQSDQDAWTTEYENAKIEENEVIRSTRKSAYGDIGDQLDEIYKDIDAWKARIKSIKDANPKE